MKVEDARRRIEERRDLNAFISLTIESGDGPVVAVKDLVDVRGTVTTAGGVLLPEEPAEADAPLVGTPSPHEVAERLFDELVPGLDPRQRVVVAERFDEVGLAAQRVAQQPARTEQPARALGRAWGLPEGLGERGRPHFALGESPELE